MLTPFTVPWVPEVFLACGRNFRCWPKADTSSEPPFQTPARLRFSCCPVGQSQPYKDLTATGNRARKVSGTQGTFTVVFRS